MSQEASQEAMNADSLAHPEVRTGRSGVARERIAAVDRKIGRFARVIATTGAVAMLGVALFTTFDVVVMRWLLASPIPGTNEVFRTIFPAAIACVLASGLCQRASLEIDLLGMVLPVRVVTWLRAFGAVVLLIAIVVITVAVCEQAMSTYQRNSHTTIMRWPLWPWYFAIAALFILCIPAQALVALRAAADLLECWWAGVLIVFGVIFVGAWAAVSVVSGMQAMFLANLLGSVGVMVALLWVMMLLYVPLAAALIATSCLGILGMFGPSQAVNVAGAETMSLFISPDLAVVPFFLMMGGFAVQSGMSRDIYAFAQAIFAPFRGGLAMATIGGSAGFGALAGSSVATVATIGSVANVEMSRRGYSQSLLAGSVAAGGTLGQLLPPSTAAVVYALLVEQSIGKIYIAMLVPAFLTIVLYIAAIAAVITLNPSSAPPGEAWNGRVIARSGARSLPVAVMFALVFGGIFFGVFTATEAAGVGSVVGFAILAMRGGLKGGGFWAVMAETTRSTSMIYFLIIGALVTTFYFAATGLPTALTGAVDSLDLPDWGVVVLLCGGFILLGFVLDSMAIMMITASLSAGIVTAHGYDPVWWAVVMVIVVEIGVITPPFGLNLFMLKSVAPELPLKSVYAGVTPFVIADIIKLALIIAAPVIVLGLSGHL